jgi:phage FluMu protein Com
MGDDGKAGPKLELLQTVRCLECGAVYAKPASGGTAMANPGCPECGYVGWATSSAPLTEPSLHLRSGEGRMRRHSA